MRMSREADLVAALRAIATDPAARGLLDDAAVLPRPAGDLVLTHDMLVEDVHYLPDDPPGDVAWKLVAVNLSDLAAKGATPLGLLLGFTLGEAIGGEAWDRGFVAGLADALGAFAVPLLGGDTVAARGARMLGLTAIGLAPRCGVPARSGARAGDGLWVTGTIGDAGVGLRVARGGPGPAAALARYRRPVPRLAEGRALAPFVHASADISDGLLIDARRMADASGIGVAIALDAVPLQHETDALAAATAGDDYELLVAAPASAAAALGALGLREVGHFAAGAGLTLTWGGAPVPLPRTLGWEHG